ncbi:rRNA maturation RNase YbeY [Thermaurantiacus sp.]
MLDLAIEVIAGPWDEERWPEDMTLEQFAGRAVRAALAGAGHAAALQAPQLDCEISILFADDAELRRLNSDWRGRDTPTNILSFPMWSKQQAARHLEAGEGSFLLGDMALAHETLAREAQEEGKPLADHLTHLLVHGTLHLLGHTHEEETEAQAMEALEIRILAMLGVPDPYGARPGVAADG